MRVSPNDGKPELLVAVKTGELVHGPQVLPGGEIVQHVVALDLVIRRVGELQNGSGTHENVALARRQPADLPAIAAVHEEDPASDAVAAVQPAPTERLSAPTG